MDNLNAQIKTAKAVKEMLGAHNDISKAMKSCEKVSFENEFLDDVELQIENNELKEKLKNEVENYNKLMEEVDLLKGELDCALTLLEGAENQIRTQQEIIDSQRDALREFRLLAGGCNE